MLLHTPLESRNSKVWISGFGLIGCIICFNEVTKSMSDANFPRPKGFQEGSGPNGSKGQRCSSRPLQIII
ncbi:hypothetical protein Hanom_Chr04g00317481 [Helianthus anomalus]